MVTKNIIEHIVQVIINLILVVMVVVGLFIPIGTVGAEDEPAPVGQSSSTSTVLLLDTSGSMDEEDITGYTKIDAAKRAARSILDVIMAEKSISSSYSHQVGLVSFDNSATVHAPLSEDLSSIRNTVDNLYDGGRTGMAYGLTTAIDMLAPVNPSHNKMIILLSDGLPNINLADDYYADVDQIIEELLGLARTARDSGICINTIGLGLPSADSLNADLLRQIAAESGCGNYYDAQNATELINTFIEIRHTSLGDILLNRQGEIAQDEQVDLGNVSVEQNQEIVLFTLNTLGSQINLEVTDPVGTLVNASYPNAILSNVTSLASLVVNEPIAGDWGVKIVGANVPDGRTDYNMLVSSRAKPTPPPPPPATATVAATVPANPQPTSDLPNTSGSGFLVILGILVLGGIGLGVYAVSVSKNAGGGAAQAVLQGNSIYTQGQRVPIPGTLIIGRGSSSNLRLESRDVSRTHAQISFANGTWYIQDLNSQLGTLVNGRAVNTAQLQPGDIISIGEYSWVFSLK